jgi:tetratricopeptide (TPR) repeat protein
LRPRFRDTAKRQFTDTRPGIIWLHIDYLPLEIFDALAYAKTGASFLDLLALAVLDSPKRSHICQLVFSGGAQLIRKGEVARSGFRQVVYNSPSCRFGDVRLFPGGKTINLSTARAGPKAKSLLAEANIRFRIAAGPKETFSAAQRHLLQRYATSTNMAERQIAANALFRRALHNRSPSELKEIIAWALLYKGVLLGQEGNVEEALGALSEAIRRFGPSSATPVENAGRALVERAGHLCDLGRYDEALTDCDEFLASYDVEGETQVSEFVAQALLIKGVSLANTDKIADAIEILEKVTARFSGKAAEPLADYIGQAEEILEELRGLEDEA